MSTEANADPTEVRKVEVGTEHAGLRLDRFLSAVLDDVSRTRVQALIRQGNVKGPSGTIGDASVRVKPGDRYVVELPPPEPAKPEGQEIPLSIVYEDRDLLIIDKPAGLVVHPAAGHADGTLVNALIGHCGSSLSGIGGVKRPGIVHRLDRDTSGLLVVAKTDLAHQGLAAQFASHGDDGRLERAYIALVWGALASRVGRIDARIGRSSTNRTKMAVVRGDAGRHAATRYQVLEVYPSAAGEVIASRVRLVLETGRTHQIRVHLAHIGHPILGDPVYGTRFKASVNKLLPAAADALAALGRQALHAAELGFDHPRTGKHMHFESAPPADVSALIAALSTKLEVQNSARRSGKRAARGNVKKIAKP